MAVRFEDKHGSLQIVVACMHKHVHVHLHVSCKLGYTMRRNLDSAETRSYALTPTWLVTGTETEPLELGRPR
jgi:hypothetical protein